ncbi:MAG: glycine cleavage system protein H [Acidobacteriia bacterium]|nr:glycine cleavage system protein H [Terriglobia bacterium]
MVALFVLLTIIALLTIDYFVQRSDLRKAGATVRPAGTESAQLAPAVARSPIRIDKVPAGVFVDPGHVWVQLEPTGTLRMGADSIPAALLGRPDRIDLEHEGTQLRRGDRIATLSRGTRSLTLRAPVDGIVTRVNAEAQASPARVQDDPFGQGWLLGLAPRDLAPALKRMFVAEEATVWAREQLQKLRDFMSAGSANSQLVGATLQDGGAPVEGLADHLDDTRWKQLVDEIFPARS